MIIQPIHYSSKHRVAIGIEDVWLEHDIVRQTFEELKFEDYARVFILTFGMNLRFVSDTCRADEIQVLDALPFDVRHKVKEFVQGNRRREPFGFAGIVNLSLATIHEIVCIVRLHKSDNQGVSLNGF